jgi:maleylacetoacetate isomerase
MGSFTLYNRFRSSSSHRVRIALNLKKIDFTYHAVPWEKEMIDSERREYLKINPMGQVPTLCHDGEWIGQSVAILDYLDRVHPAIPLFPSEPLARSRVVQVCEVINSGTQPLMNSAVLESLVERYGISTQSQKEWAQHWIREGLSAFETYIKPYAGNFCFGDSPCAADCFLIPQMEAAKRFEISSHDFPILDKIAIQCGALPEFKLASPEKQPDYRKL